jgi:hypothetical protein
MLTPTRDYETAARNQAIPGETSVSVPDDAWIAIAGHLEQSVSGGSGLLAGLASARNDAPFPSWKNENRPMSVDLDENGCRALVKALVQSDIEAMDPDVGRKAWELVATLASGAVRGGVVGY